MTATDLLSIAVIALAVFLPKALPLILTSEQTLKPIQRWLDFVAPAVLAALVAPAIFTTDHALTGFRPVHLVFLATFLAALGTRRMLPSLAAGGAALLVIVVLTGPASTM